MAEGRRRVHERFGVELEPEVQVLGRGRVAAVGSWGEQGAGAHAARLPLRPLGSRLVRAGRWRFCALVAALGGRHLHVLAARPQPVRGEVGSGWDGIPARVERRGAAAGRFSSAGREMTTLHVRPDALRQAAARFPLVDSVRANPDFPNSLTVHVSERHPVALIDGGAVAGRR